MSVEQKIREALKFYENYVRESITLEPTPVEYKKVNLNQATQAILQIIESDVIGEDILWQLDRNQLRAEQRANLGEDKS